MGHTAERSCRTLAGHKAMSARQLTDGLALLVCDLGVTIACIASTLAFGGDARLPHSLVDRFMEGPEAC